MLFAAHIIALLLTDWGFPFWVSPFSSCPLTQLTWGFLQCAYATLPRQLDMELLSSVLGDPSSPGVGALDSTQPGPASPNLATIIASNRTTFLCVS